MRLIFNFSLLTIGVLIIMLAVVLFPVSTRAEQEIDCWVLVMLTSSLLLISCDVLSPWYLEAGILKNELHPNFHHPPLQLFIAALFGFLNCSSS